MSCGRFTPLRCIAFEVVQKFCGKMFHWAQDHSPFDVVGWCGALIVLLAYTLVSTRRVEGDSVLFQVLNISGAALLLANTFYLGAYPSAFVNMIWIGIGGYALYRRQRNLRTTTS